MHLRLHEALRAGDLEGVRFALGNPPDWANARDALLHLHVLAHAISHAPLALVRMLLDDGADPNFDDGDGFPSLLAVFDADRADRHELLALLLARGADPAQRGINDWTPLHVAAIRDDARAIELLLAHGADPEARTRIDDLETPLEAAERAGAQRAVAALRPARRPKNVPSPSDSPDE
jgi:ankyrin repeat protein